MPSPKKLLPPLPLSIILLLVAGGALAYYLKSSELPPAERYKLSTIETGDVSQTVSANGTLNPVTLVNVGTQVSGTVKKLYVDFNGQVEKGQALAELDDALLSAQARQSEASVASAGASLDLAKANETRMRSLFGQEYVSRQELDQAVQALRAAEAQLRLSRALHDKDLANLGYTVIRSPVSGVVVDRQVDVGQTVAASFQTPVLFKIAQDLAQMQIDSAFAEADVGSIRVGQPVRFNVDAFPNRSFSGQVKQIRLNPTTTSNVVTYNVVVNVENPDQILLPGMTAYVNITVANRQNALLVPNGALRFKPTEDSQPPVAGTGQRPGGLLGGMSPMGAPRGAGGQRKASKREGGNSAKGTVYVLREGKIESLSIDLGITDNRNTEITGGELKTGDQVIVGENTPGSTTAPNTSTLRMRAF